MTEEDFIIGIGGRKILLELLRLDIFDREILHNLLECFKKSMDWPEVKSFHNMTLNLFITSLVSMLIKFESEGKMESSIQDGYLTVKAKVVKVEELEKYIGQHRAFACTDKSVRIDTHDRNIIEKMLNCMENIVAKEEEKQYFISKFHHRTLKKFFDILYKLLFETDKLRHFNNCVDKDGDLYISTPYVGT
jgi:hypothetical protein